MFVGFHSLYVQSWFTAKFVYLNVRDTATIISIKVFLKSIKFLFFFTQCYHMTSEVLQSTQVVWATIMILLSQFFSSLTASIIIHYRWKGKENPGQCAGIVISFCVLEWHEDEQIITMFIFIEWTNPLCHFNNRLCPQMTYELLTQENITDTNIQYTHSCGNIKLLSQGSFTLSAVRDKATGKLWPLHLSLHRQYWQNTQESEGL